MPATTSPNDPKLDKWLRPQEPRVELALRYAVRGRSFDATTSPAFNARVDELFVLLKLDEDALADILRLARHLGGAIEQHITGKGNGAKVEGKRGWWRACESSRPWRPTKKSPLTLMRRAREIEAMKERHQCRLRIGR